MSVCESSAGACKWQQMLFYRDLSLAASLCTFEWHHYNAQQAVRAVLRQGELQSFRHLAVDHTAQVCALAALLLLQESLC